MRLLTIAVLLQVAEESRPVEGIEKGIDARLESFGDRTGVLIHIIFIILRPVHRCGLHHEGHELCIQVSRVDTIIKGNIKSQHRLLENFLCRERHNGNFLQVRYILHHLNNNSHEVGMIIGNDRRLPYETNGAYNNAVAHENGHGEETGAIGSSTTAGLRNIDVHTRNRPTAAIGRYNDARKLNDPFSGLCFGRKTDDSSQYN